MGKIKNSSAMSVEELVSLLQEVKQVKQWYRDNLQQIRQEEQEGDPCRSSLRIVSFQEYRPQEPEIAVPKTEIHPRLASFLEYDNSFLSPWNFSPSLDDEEREREKLGKIYRQRPRRNLQCMKMAAMHGHDLVEAPSRVSETINASDHTEEWDPQATIRQFHTGRELGIGN